MPTPQPAIFRENTPHHYFLEFHLRPGWRQDALKRSLAAALDACPAETSVLLAFGRDAWERLAPDAVPDNFIAFHAVLGQQDRTAPGTQGDLLFWLHGERHDLNLQCALAIGRALAGIATLAWHGINRVTAVVGPFLIAASIASALRQTGAIALNTELPILVIVLGVLMLAAVVLPLQNPKM